jgi:hypothetical protein
MKSLSSTTHGAFIDPSAPALTTQLRQIYDGLHPYATNAKHNQSLSEATAAVALVLIASGILVSGLRFGRPL